MVHVYRNCPACGEEIEFEVQPVEGEEGENLAEITDVLQLCTCTLDPAVQEKLEQEAIDRADFSYGENI